MMACQHFSSYTEGGREITLEIVASVSIPTSDADLSTP